MSLPDLPSPWIDHLPMTSDTNTETPKSGDASFTQLLHRAADGDEQAKLHFGQLVYDELRVLAAKVVARRGGRDQPTSVVNEFFQKRLLKTEFLAKIKGRRYFYVAAFNQMRNLLIDRARKRRPTPVVDTTLSTLDLIVESIEEQNGHDLESLDLAIEALRAHHPRQYEVLYARIWGGLTIAQTANLFELSAGTVERDYRLARAKLKLELERRMTK